MPTDVLFQIFSGLAEGRSDARLAPFTATMHPASWAPAATSLLGAGGSPLRTAPGPVAQEAA